MNTPIPIQPIIIGVTGYKQSGKDTVVTQLHVPMLISNRYATHLSFAGAIYEDVAKEFEISVEHLRNIKSNPLVRHVLQYYGTELGRDIHGDDIWIKRLEERMNQWLERCQNPAGCIAPLNLQEARPIVFISDVRFVNEAEWVRAKGGSIIRVEREGQQNTDLHPSEQQIDKIHPDWFIKNDGCNLIALSRDCKFVAQHIVERYKL